jgi:hypothetical protein
MKLCPRCNSALEKASKGHSLACYNCPKVIAKDGFQYHWMYYMIGSNSIHLVLEKFNFYLIINPDSPNLAEITEHPGIACSLRYTTISIPLDLLSKTQEQIDAYINQVLIFQ